MSWDDFLEVERSKQYFIDLESFLEKERNDYTIYPSSDNVFNAYSACDYNDVKVVILGQDPYHQPNQAMGLSFSVPDGFKKPPSLVNIFKEMKSDIGVDNVSGDLRPWANQGVFLLNALLTVRDSEPASHKKQGWETFTDNTIKFLSQREKPMVFILWGNWAQGKIQLIASHHKIIKSAHPSPLGAYRGFWESRPFSKTNDFLIENGINPIDWSTD